MKVLSTILFLSITVHLSNAQFPNIKWQYNTGAPSFGSAAAADMDRDGFYEIVFTTYTNDGRAHCLNAEDGSVRWIYDIGGCGDVAPIIYDMDNDDTLDVIVNGSCNPTIFCINGYTGALKWSKPSGGGDSPPTVADIDNDGKPEVLFCNFNGQLRIYNGEDGSTNKIIQVDPHNGPIQTEPTLVDVNNDQQLDIIMASHFNTSGLYVWAYDYLTEDTIWMNYMTDTSTYNAYHGGAVADVDGDGLLEYVIGSNNRMVRALNVEDGSVRWTRILPQSNMAPVSIADLDGNGDLEIVVTNNDWITFDERIWVLDGMTGNTEWSYPTTFSSFRGCAIADINGNDTLDLVAGYFMGDVIAVEPFSGLIWETNLLSEFQSGLPYFEVDHGPLVADFDHNGTMDVFVVGGYGTYTPDTMNTGKAFLLEAGNGKCPEWLMLRQDVYRSGYLSPNDINESCSEVLNLTSETHHNILMYPNPTDDYLIIEMQTNGRIKIWDVNGKILYNKFENSDLVTLQLKNWDSGIYMIEIEREDKIFRNKLIIQKN